MQSSIQSSPMKYAMHQTKNSCLFVCVTSMCSVKEMFVHFAEVERITGRELARHTSVLSKSLGLSLTNLRG